MKQFWIFKFGFSIGTSKRKRMLCLALCALILALNFPAEAQQRTKVPRIGFVTGSGREAPNVEAFQLGLRDLGYVDGKNILSEYRYAEGENERFPSLVAELLQLKVDVLVITAVPAIRAAKQATKTIPIVVLINADPVAMGIVDSLARPGGNITGLAKLTRELGGKRLELLKEAVPRIARVGVLWNATGTALDFAFKEYEAAARALKIQLQSLEIRGPNPNVEGAFQAAAKEQANGLITITDALLNRYPKRIAELAIKNRLPSICERNDYVEAGCLMSYSANDADVYRRAATYVDKILKGTKPSELPMEQPTKFEFIINLKTAKKIGLTIPQSVLYRADKVIK
jgi:putative tryptophan/tyrosine transport system substrate-binding protein